MCLQRRISADWIWTLKNNYIDKCSYFLLLWLWHRYVLYLFCDYWTSHMSKSVFFFSIEKETHLPTQVNKNKVQLCIKSTIRTFFNGQNIITKLLECNFHQPILKSPKTKWIKKKKKAAEVIPCNQSSSCACWLVYCIGVQYSTTVNTIKKKGTKEVVAEWKQRIGVNFLRGSSTFLYFCLHRRKMNSGSRKYWDATPN